MIFWFYILPFIVFNAITLIVTLQTTNETGEEIDIEFLKRSFFLSLLPMGNMIFVIGLLWSMAFGLLWLMVFNKDFND